MHFIHSEYKTLLYCCVIREDGQEKTKLKGGDPRANEEKLPSKKIKLFQRERIDRQE